MPVICQTVKANYISTDGLVERSGKTIKSFKFQMADQLFLFTIPPIQIMSDIWQTVQDASRALLQSNLRLGFTS